MYEARVNDHEPIEVIRKDAAWLPALGGANADIRKVDAHTFHVLQKGTSHKVFVVAVNQDEKTVDLLVNGKKAKVQLSTDLDRLLRKLGMEGSASSKAADIKAPMPGLIHSFSVSEGDTVAKGNPVLILEAMKMENVIKAPADVKVARIHVKKGDSVEKGQLLVSFER
jgi:biotin carboxyl carrier protein